MKTKTIISLTTIILIISFLLAGNISHSTASSDLLSANNNASEIEESNTIEKEMCSTDILTNAFGKYILSKEYSFDWFFTIEDHPDYVSMRLYEKSPVDNSCITVDSYSIDKTTLIGSGMYAKEDIDFSEYVDDYYTY